MAAEKNKFDDRINELYSHLLDETTMGAPGSIPGQEPDTPDEEDITLSPAQMASARKKVERDKILGFNIGKSAKIKKELDRKAKLDDEMENGPKMDEIIDKLTKSNNKLEAELRDLD